ncbi:hypothetical protein [Kitasatospora sp. NPDC057223]|uniref:hypothetical protein n=1 Tax=Kitasatospora sp. NPDC057223 TaxID=3346055 RepID=UPI003644E9D0
MPSEFSSPTLRRRRGLLPVAAVTVLAAVAAATVGGCSSDGSPKAAAPPPATATTTATATATASPSPSPAAPSPLPESPTAQSPTVDPPATPTATAKAPTAYGARPADACTMLTAAQVSAAVGTSDRFVGTHPDPAQDGSEVWGCTWGSHLSYASLRELTAVQFAYSIGSPDLTATRVPGIGDQALIAVKKSNGGTPHLAFLAGLRYYVLEVVVDRGSHDATNADQEIAAEKQLGTVLATALKG